MTPSPTIDVALDLRSWQQSVRTPRDLMALWQKVESSLLGRTLAAGQVVQFARDENDRLGVTVLAVPPGAGAVAPGTGFAIHSILEAPQVQYACAVCSRQGRRRYAPLLCWESARQGEVVRLCQGHAVLLEGSLRAFHPERVPRCQSGSGRPATFWCFGPLCPGGRPWSREEHRSHPRDREISFCRHCHEELFPPCSQAGCRRIGYFRCEFVDPAGRAECRVPACPRHCFRWQIFGPEKEGLVLCPRHSRIASLSDADLVLLMFLGMAARRVRLARHRDAELPPLPTLASGRHVFLNVRQKPYDPRLLMQLFLGTEPRLAAQGKLEQELRQMIKYRRPRWEEETSRAPDPRGDEYLQRIKQAYQARGLHQVADRLRLSEFKPPRDDRPPLVFVYVDHAVIGLAKGKGSATIQAVGEAVGAQVMIERDA